MGYDFFLKKHSIPNVSNLSFALQNKMSDLEDIPDIVFDNALPATEQAAFTAADLKTVRAEISDKNKYNMVEAEQRNVLFVGRARSVKQRRNAGRSRFAAILRMVLKLITRSISSIRQACLK